MNSTRIKADNHCNAVFIVITFVLNAKFSSIQLTVTLLTHTLFPYFISYYFFYYFLLYLHRVHHNSVVCGPSAVQTAAATPGVGDQRCAVRVRAQPGHGSCTGQHGVSVKRRHKKFFQFSVSSFQFFIFSGLEVSHFQFFRKET